MNKTPSGPQSSISDLGQIRDTFINFIESQRPIYDDLAQEDILIPLPPQFQLRNPQVIQDICDRYLEAQWTLAEFADDNKTFKLSRRALPPSTDKILPAPPTSATEISQNFDEFKNQFVQYVNAQRQQRDNGCQIEIEIPLPVNLRVFDQDQQSAIKQLFYQQGWVRVEFAQGAKTLRLYRQSLRP
ncbi:hypothetical protein ACQ4M3_12980 [Leptolyngbya sp. AN03gr2]|uniref:hypothetical protein n=1 Tax=unclassified Leptolyngbya TaxID=2650499 RepID=UPI003D313E8B